MFRQYIARPQTYIDTDQAEAQRTWLYIHLTFRVLPQAIIRLVNYFSYE